MVNFDRDLSQGLWLVIKGNWPHKTLISTIKAYWDNFFTMNISLQSPMSAVLESFPGAQRALFRRYHIGGGGRLGRDMPQDKMQGDFCAGDAHVAPGACGPPACHQHGGDAFVFRAGPPRR